MFRPSNKHWYTIYNQSPIGIALVGLDGSWLSANAALCNLLEYTEDQLLTKTFRDVTHPADIKPDDDLLIKVAAGEIDGYEMIKRYITKRNNVVWVKLTAASIKENGQIIHYLVHIQPLINGEKKQVEKVGDDLVVRPTVTVRDFMIDNWQWFIGAVASVGSAIVVLSVLLYTSNAKLNIQIDKSKDLERTLEIIEERLNRK